VITVNEEAQCLLGVVRIAYGVVRIAYGVVRIAYGVVRIAYGVPSNFVFLFKALCTRSLACLQP